MGLRQMAGLGSSPSEAMGESAPQVSDRCLTLLVQGAAQNMPEIDEETYNAFRKKISEEAMQVPDRLPVEDKLALIQSIVREFESYRTGAEGALKDRQSGWRALVSMQLKELLERVGVDAGSSEAAPLVAKVAGLETGEQIQAYRERLLNFLHPSGAEQGIPVGASKLKTADRTTENDNAAGLRGGGSALEHLRPDSLLFSDWAAWRSSASDSGWRPCRIASWPSPLFLPTIFAAATPSSTGATLRCWLFWRAVPTNRF